VVVLGDWDTIHESLVVQGDAFLGLPDMLSVFPKEFKISDMVEKFGGTDQLEIEFWKIQRRFTVATLRNLGVGRTVLELKINEEVEKFLEVFQDQNNKPFDPSAALSAAATNVICGLVFGKRFDYDSDILRILLNYVCMIVRGAKFSVLTPMVLSSRVAQLGSHSPKGREVKKAQSVFIDLIREEVDKTLQNYHEGDEPSNYVEAFRKAQLDEKDNWTFTNEQLIVGAAKLFMAGSESTAATIGWAMLYLAHHPEVQETLYQEIKRESNDQGVVNYADRSKLPYTEATIMETQRLASVAVGLVRKAVAPSTIRGYKIPAGAIIYPLFTAVLADPKTYPNPEKFDPSRFLNGKNGKENDDARDHMVPFGVGKRSCFGAGMARMEAFLFLTGMISKYKIYFPPNEPKPPIDGSHISINRTPLPYKICAQRRED